MFYVYWFLCPFLVAMALLHQHIDLHAMKHTAIIKEIANISNLIHISPLLTPFLSL